MIDYRKHNSAARTLRLAKTTSLELSSRELDYQARLAKKQLHNDRLALNKTSLVSERERELNI